MEYTLIRSDRKTLAVQIRDGRVIVRAPRFASRVRIEAFLREKSSWIEKHLQAAKDRENAAAGQGKFSEAELKKLSAAAKKVIPQRAAYYARLLGVSYGRIAIRAQHTRWGSCSSKGNLNFNCLLMLVPPEVLDSVVVHELCHRKHMDHSKKFYAEVYSVFPEYDKYHKWLKANGAALMARLP